MGGELKDLFEVFIGTSLEIEVAHNSGKDRVGTIFVLVRVKTQKPKMSEAKNSQNAYLAFLVRHENF